MLLTQEDIAEFQALYREEFGEELTKEEARNRATDLLILLRAVYGPEQRRHHV